MQPASADLPAASPDPSAAAAASQPAAGSRGFHTSHCAPVSAQWPPDATLHCKSKQGVRTPPPCVKHAVPMPRQLYPQKCTLYRVRSSFLLHLEPYGR